MSQRRDEHKHIKALIEQHTAQRRRESDREAAVRQRGRVPQPELEKPIPADVPLHKRGFGVMDENGP
jgi:hypothetical protein